MNVRTRVLCGIAFGSAIAALSSVASAAGTVFPIVGGGGQESPAGDPDGTLTGSITIDPATNTLSWNLTYTNILAPTLMHIHTGQDGTNGSVFVDMGVVTTGGPGTLINSKVITASQATTILTNPQNHYLNVHNSAFPAGVVRAQLPIVYKVALRGAQEVGGGDLDGTATGQVWLDTGNNKVGWNINYVNIAAPSDFHIHSGALGFKRRRLHRARRGNHRRRRHAHQRGRDDRCPARPGHRRALELLPERPHRRVPERRDARPSAGGLSRGHER
jgi:hypothetical protein